MRAFSNFYLPTQYFSDVCRVCLSKHKVLVPIEEISLTHNLKPSGFAEQIKLKAVFIKFCNVEVDASDKKPQKICEFCINMVCKAFNFFQLFLYSNLLLDKKLEESRLSQDEPNLHEGDQNMPSVVDQAMCSSSFHVTSNEDETLMPLVKSKGGCEGMTCSTPVIPSPTQNMEYTGTQRKKRKYVRKRPPLQSWLKSEGGCEGTSCSTPVTPSSTQNMKYAQRKKRKYVRRHPPPNWLKSIKCIDPVKRDALQLLLNIKNKIQPVVPAKRTPIRILRNLEHQNEIFRCQLCGEVFHDITKVVQHLKDRHEDTKRCILCSKWIARTHLLIYHVIEHSPKGLICRICRLYFESQETLNHHKENVDHTNTKQCPHCQKTFRIPSLVRYHIDKVHFKKAADQCKICGKMFRYYGNLRRHEINTHGNKRFLCQSCGKHFSTLYQLKVHMQVVHELNQGIIIKKYPLQRSICTPKVRRKDFKCKFCPKMVHTKHAFFMHSEQHPEFKDYNCSICSQIFETRREYLNHRKSHEKYECPFPNCTKLFILRTAASMHKYTHKPILRCPCCSRLFPTKKRLQDHMNVHTGERPYKCPKCGKGFKQNAHVDTHMISMHGGQKRWQCKLCNKAFSFPVGLTIHMRSHRGEKPFPCPFCKKMFRDTTGRQKHVKKDHPKKLQEFFIYKEKYQEEEKQRVEQESAATEKNI